MEKQDGSIQQGGRKPLLLRKFSDLGTFISNVYQEFIDDRCMILASGIVYSTLISIVPFIAFILTLLSAFNVFDDAVVQVRVFIDSNLGQVAGEQLSSLLDSFITNARGLSAVSLISFLITSVLLFNRVWISINQIYHTPMDRSLARFGRFVTILILGTLLLGAYLSINSIFSRWFLSVFNSGILSGWFYPLLTTITPWLIPWFLFFLIIFIVPRNRVKLGSALLGSFSGAVGFFVANWLFSRVIIRIVNFSLIYGSLASILIALFWVYIIWQIIFVGVEIAYVHQYPKMVGKKHHLENSPDEQLAIGIDLMISVGVKFQKGKGASSLRELCSKLGYSERKLLEYLNLYTDYELLIVVHGGNNPLYLPAKPLESIAVSEIITLLYQGSDEEGLENPLLSEGAGIAARMLESSISSLEHVMVSDLVDKSQ